MVSPKLVQRTNASLNLVEILYTYSWIIGLDFGYFQFFQSAFKKAEKNQFYFPADWNYIHGLTKTRAADKRVA